MSFRNLGERMDASHEAAGLIDQALANMTKINEILASARLAAPEAPVSTRDWNGHVASEPDPEVQRIRSAVATLEALGFHWDAERSLWIPPEGDE